LGTLLLSAADIEALQREKQDYKKHRKSKQKERSTFRRERVKQLMIIFQNTESSAAEEIEKVLQLKQEKCIVGRICIYSNYRDVTLSEIKRQLSPWESDIESISIYQTPHFERY